MEARQDADQGRVPFATVLSDELEVIAAQRKARGLDDTAVEAEATFGVAISGGGIRSASFGLGVLQALNKAGLMRCVDYLSTVSGGGYIGAALSWLNHQRRTAGEDWEFPFPRDRGARVLPAGVTESSDTLNYLRQHGDYLIPAPGMDSVALGAAVLRNAAFTFGLLLLSLIGLCLLGMAVGVFDKLSILGSVGFLQFAESWNPIGFLALTGAALLVLFMFLFAFFTWIPVYSTQNSGYKWRLFFHRLQGWLLRATVVLGVVAFLPLAYAKLSVYSDSWWGSLGRVAPAVLGGMGAWYQFTRERRGVGGKISKLGGLRIWLTAGLLIFGLLLLAYSIADDIAGTKSWDGQLTRAVQCLLAAALGGFFVNTNLFGLGRMYRDRLMEAFLPNAESVQQNRWGPARAADVAFLSDVCSAQSFGPYHLINTNVVLVDAVQEKFRSRGGDNFVLAGAYSGGDALGWYRNEDFENGEMTLATAMSISGAALNPNAAVAGAGPTRNRLVAFMLAALNIRLGFWARNPAANRMKRYVAKRFGPNLLYPGLLQGLLGSSLNEHAGFLEMTDGGHFDNTGLYELIRRRVDTILLSDAGADTEFELADLANAFQRTHVDFGVRIEFEDADYDLNGLVPGSETKSQFAERFKMSRQGHAIANIHYPPCRVEGGWLKGKTGTLLIVKTSMVAGLPGELFSYRARNESFPNQSTADQFFDEAQMEAYRRLGLCLGTNLLKTSSVSSALAHLLRACTCDMMPVAESPSPPSEPTGAKAEERDSPLPA